MFFSVVVNLLDVCRVASGGRAVDGKPSTISWRADVRDNNRSERTMTGGSSSTGGNSGGGRRKWSIRTGRRSSDSRGGRGGSALLGQLDDDDLDCDLFDDELDFRHQHDTTSVQLQASHAY